jgi:hypothetical protein
MRRSATVRALGVTTRPSVHRRSGLFGPHRRTSFGGVICSARAAVSLLLPARIGRLFAFLRARLNGAHCTGERNAAVTRP